MAMIASTHPTDRTLRAELASLESHPIGRPPRFHDLIRPSPMRVKNPMDARRVYRAASPLVNAVKALRGEHATTLCGARRGLAGVLRVQVERDCDVVRGVEERPDDRHSAGRIEVDEAPEQD